MFFWHCLCRLYVERQRAAEGHMDYGHGPNRGGLHSFPVFYLAGATIWVSGLIAELELCDQGATIVLWSRASALEQGDDL
jgi:hypothetical protein